MSAGTSGSWADSALSLPGAARFLNSDFDRRQFARQTLKCSTLWSSSASPLQQPGCAWPTAGLLASLTAQCAYVTHPDQGARERLGAPLHLPQRPLTCGHFSGAYGSQTAGARGRNGVVPVCSGGEKDPPRSYFLPYIHFEGNFEGLLAARAGAPVVIVHGWLGRQQKLLSCAPPLRRTEREQVFKKHFVASE